MNDVRPLITVGLVTLAAWLAAQCLLTLWHGPALAPLPLAQAPQSLDLLSAHWQRSPPPATGQIPLTRLELTWVGGMRAEPLAATVVVLSYQQRQQTLTQGQRLAPGIVLQRIDEQGLIFDNNGRLERLPWPADRPLQGLKHHG
ncbi:general secretion pathway protein C [Pseudomonas cuatrocienegasensis]|uniref:General secretion pathway protein C n=1 Tax=Pseudomonas cuatrocienegasensis TaxID=543360 RepID=A0ABY1BDL0_9PSED|nr:MULTISPECIES: hypothetical protein [Pseudomonas]OEC33819.1 hypothetical protein A7D25_17030 [Pseudomonas sp. 21C1]SEQ59783.1 general secretion pathway protein C [Pseudomonas cuatrocienegasensis]